MKSNTNMIKKFINSIYNIDEFPKYVKDGARKAVLYALLLSLFIGTVSGIFEFININTYINKIVNTINQDENSFRISNSELNLENSPIKFQDNKILFYADDNIKIDEANTLKKLTVNEDINFLVLKDGLFIETYGDYDNIGDFKVYYSDMNIDNDITNAELTSFVKSLKVILCIITIVSNVVQGFFEYIISSLLIALVTLIPSKLMGINYSFRRLFSLVIYAYTLPNLLVLILSIIFPNIEFSTTSMIGAIVYTYLSIRNIRNKINEKVV